MLAEAFAAFCSGREERVHAAVLCVTGDSASLPRGPGIAGEGPVCPAALAPAPPQSLGGQLGELARFLEIH